ncbi:DUF169 domain-containing protein [uncultured Methanomethylovorans sp.]|uniref:DUF169 domain-containing protein n=1 Tax=uncultured Methanomethylovorans sp. TaxID=183759 RepID=UPI002AA6AB44|nr:DUF169 domain-containing protein [uncultured Methanomethylovorans sp.]
MVSVGELGKKLVEAGRLKLRPLCVYGSDKMPQDAVPSYKIDRCIARVAYSVALSDKISAVYVEAGHEQCCGGGLVWMGFAEPHPKLKYFVTVGTPDFRGGAAENLKATAELFDEQKKRIGIITPPGKYIIIAPCTDEIELATIRSVLLFAGAEQIRNLCGLAQFSSSNPFFKTLIPAGATCSVMITFPAGMAEHAPKDSAYIGPTDPTGNLWFPPDMLVMGIPASLAIQMSTDLDESFIGRRSKIAYPEKRIRIEDAECTFNK